MSGTATLPALDAIRAALDATHEPGEVVEVRILRAIKNRFTVAPEFDRSY